MTIAANDFVHLHAHSEFSLLDGLGRIPDLVELQDHGLPEQGRLNEQLRRLAPETGLALAWIK